MEAIHLVFSRHTYKELKQSLNIFFFFLKKPRLFLNCNKATRSRMATRSSQAVLSSVPSFLLVM